MSPFVIMKRSDNVNDGGTVVSSIILRIHAAYFVKKRCPRNLDSEGVIVFAGKIIFCHLCKTTYPKRKPFVILPGGPDEAPNSARRSDAQDGSELRPSGHGVAVQHSGTGPSSGQAWVASRGLLFPPPQSRSEKISSRLAGNHPYHTRKRQQRGEFNDRSNCCGSPTLCCGGVMNDNCNAPRCEKIAAAWLLFKPICYGCNFSLGLFSWGNWLDFK